MIDEPRCSFCDHGIVVSVDDNNEIMATGNIACAIKNGLDTYLKDCCFISYWTGLAGGTEIDRDLKMQILDSLPKKVLYVELDAVKHMVYKVDRKTRKINFQNTEYSFKSSVRLTKANAECSFISRKDYLEG